MMRVEPGDVLQGRYRLDEHIAVGGMGEVWQGTDLVLDRKVAVKLLRSEYADDEDLLRRFRAEAHLAGLLSHPNIAHVYDFRDAVPPDPAYLVMEYVDGHSLNQLLHDGPLEPARTMDIVAQAARGLAAAHRAGLVHRDVKPGNLLTGPGGVVKVSDFGIARAESETPVTRTGLLPGTPGYMAPERAAGASATAASDLYSLGVVAFQCLTGRAPFEGDALAVALAHMERDMPPLPPAVPVGVAVLVADLTSKDPMQRPSSASDVAARAERLRASLTDDASGQELPAAGGTLPDLQPVAGLPAEQVRPLRPRTWQRQRMPARAAFSAAAVAAVAAAGFTGWMLGVRLPSGPGAGLPDAPQATATPGHSAPAGLKLPPAHTGVTATPAAKAKPSARPSVSATPSPTSLPSGTPSPTPPASASPTAPPTPTPSSTATEPAAITLH
jgi:serine/threonine-protein kinase